MPSLDAANPNEADSKGHLKDAEKKQPESPLVAEVDEFGLPVRKPTPITTIGAESEDASTEEGESHNARAEVNGHKIENA
jgi:hypothetical protein